MRKKSFVLILFLVIVITFSVSTMVSATTYRSKGFISKAFKIDQKQKVGTVTGSILYQKNYSLTKDRIVFSGIVTNGLTADFYCYKNEEDIKKYTRPQYNGEYRFQKPHKISKSYTYAKMKIDSSYKEKVTLIADES